MASDARERRKEKGEDSERVRWVDEMSAIELPHQEDLRRLFDYDHEKGLLIWRYRKDKDICWNGRLAGKIAGSVNKGYRIIKFDDRKYAAHRLIWKWVYGSIPCELQIDHIDGDGLNNRIDNLRLVTNQENQANRHADNKRKNGVKFKGVYKHNNKFKAEITTKSGRKYLGLFNTPEEAAHAYNEAANEHHGEHAKLNKVAS